MRKFDKNFGENYRDVLETVMTDEEKKRFQERWNDIPENKRKFKMRNIWRFFREINISMRTVRKIKKEIKKREEQQKLRGR